MTEKTRFRRKKRMMTLVVDIPDDVATEVEFVDAVAAAIDEEGGELFYEGLNVHEVRVGDVYQEMGEE